jgi:hypothetical protein
MSAIAEWYILRAERIPDLIAAARQQTRGSWWKSPQRDYAAFWEFLASQSTSGPGLDASGWVMNPLLLYLQEKLGAPVKEAETHPVVAQAALDTLLVIEAGDAPRWLSAVQSGLSDEGGLKGYLAEYYGDDWQPADPWADDPHVAALRYLQQGLSKLDSASVLLLSIG